MKNENKGYIYVLPWIIGFILLTIGPIISSFYYSFTDYNMVTDPSFVGLNNFIKLFKDQEFVNSLKATAKYTILTVPLQLIFALFISFLLNFKLKGINLYRTAYYIPSILGGNVAIAILWRFMFQPNGLINTIFGAFGISSVPWLSSPRGAMAVVILLKVWQFGSSMLLFLAALKDIPQELYEAASLDGANKIKQFFSITVPMITPTIFFNLVMQLNNAMQEFNGPYLVTGKGPLNSTYLTSMFIYDKAFKSFEMGYSSAASWVLFVLIVLVTIILFSTQKYWVYYADDGGGK